MAAPGVALDMKPTSPFAARCPTCKRAMGFHFGKPDTAWPCLACALPICCWCYVGHTERCFVVPAVTPDREARMDRAWEKYKRGELISLDEYLTQRGLA